MTPALVLSVFPGIDLLGRGFEAHGYCVVRGPDLLWGGDIRKFHVPRNRFDGVIGGSPCQDFSGLRRNPPTGYGQEMLDQFCRVVAEAWPTWFVLENVPRVPDLVIDGYTIQRIDLNARECGAIQSRPRHFQIGSRVGLVVVPERLPRPAHSAPAITATEGRRKDRRTFADFCELQGLDRDFDLPGMTKTARYAAVGNGVHVRVAFTLAAAIREASRRRKPIRVCACNCGRPVNGNQTMATAGCRKRMERRRRRD